MAATRFEGNCLVILGALGDLSRRHLLPAIAHLHRDGLLPASFRVVGIDLPAMTRSTFRELVRSSLERHASSVPESHRLAVMHSVDYLAGDLDKDADLSDVLGGSCPVVVYLALPPATCSSAARALDAAGLARGSRIVAEKPFGLDRRSARKLNADLGGLVGHDNLFRADHFLHHQLVQDILALRLSSGPFECVWNRDHVQKVEVVWEERSGVADGGAGYDTIGALHDMVQSHLMQILAVVAMDAPAELNARAFRDQKVHVLRRVGALSAGDASRHTRRARYTRGAVAGVPIAGYIEERGVDPCRQTETWVSVQLEVATPRWNGVPYVLRTGKALADPQRHISLHLRTSGGERPRVLRLSADAIALDIAIAGAQGLPETRAGRLLLHREQQQLPPSARLLRDVLAGDQTFFVSADEVEECWRVVEAVRAGWRTGSPALQEYAAGSPGPFGADVASDSRHR